MKQYRFPQSLNPGFEIFMEKPYQYQSLDIQYHQRIAEDLENFKAYYSGDLPYHLCRNMSKFRFLFVFFCTFFVGLYLLYSGIGVEKTDDNILSLNDSVLSPWGGTLYCASHTSSGAMDVNHVSPADIEYIAALGDSITAAYGSKNESSEPYRENYFGNSYATGGDEKLSGHITLANILRVFNPNLKGISHLTGYGPNSGLNVAVSGRTVEDLPRQAQQLVKLFKERYIAADYQNKWKLINIFIGTNDLGNLGCYKIEPPVPVNTYKAKLEESISIIKKELPKTIISIIGMWNSEIAIEARSIIVQGKRTVCGNDTSVIDIRAHFCNEYRRQAYEIQNEEKFVSEDFAVVVQPFLENVKEPVRDKNGNYDISFYAEDIFHLSKYGNGVFATWLWNNLLEPVGMKTKHALENVAFNRLQCPDEDAPYIRTIRNS